MDAQRAPFAFQAEIFVLLMRDAEGRAPAALLAISLVLSMDADLGAAAMLIN